MLQDVYPQHEELLIEIKLDPKSTQIAIDRAVKYIQRFCSDQPKAELFQSSNDLLQYLENEENGVATFSRPVELAGVLTLDPIRKSIAYVTGLGKGKVEFFVFDDRFVFKGSIGSWIGGWSEYINWNRLYGEIKKITFLKQKDQFIKLPYHKFTRASSPWKSRYGRSPGRYTRSDNWKPRAPYRKS